MVLSCTIAMAPAARTTVRVAAAVAASALRMPKPPSSRHERLRMERPDRFSLPSGVMARSWPAFLGDAEGPEETAEERRGLFGRLRDSLGKSRRALGEQLQAAAFDPGD